MADIETAAAAPEDSDDITWDHAGARPWADDGSCAVCGGTCADTSDEDEDDWDERDERGERGDDDPDWEVLEGLLAAPGEAHPGAAPRPDGGPALPFHVVRTDAEVLDHTCALVAGDRDGPFTMWVVFLDGDGTVLPAMMPIDGVPQRPVAREVDGLLANVRHVLADATSDGSAVVALVRRGGGDRGDLELAWTRALSESAGRQDVHLRAVVAVGSRRARLLLASPTT